MTSSILASGHPRVTPWSKCPILVSRVLRACVLFGLGIKHGSGTLKRRTYQKRVTVQGQWLCDAAGRTSVSPACQRKCPGRRTSAAIDAGVTFPPSNAGLCLCSLFSWCCQNTPSTASSASCSCVLRSGSPWGWMSLYFSITSGGKCAWDCPVLPLFCLVSLPSRDNVPPDGPAT